MSKENAENTPTSNHKDGKDESFDTDDMNARQTEVSRKVLSENTISPTNTPTRSLPSVSRKSSSPKTNNTALPGHQRQSTSSIDADKTANAASGGWSPFSSCADQTYASSQAVESTSGKIGDGSTSDVMDVLPSGSSSRQSEDSLSTCSAEENSSTKRTNIIQTSEPSAYTGVKVIVPSNTSDPKDSPLVFVSSTGYEEETSSSQEQNDQLGGFAADILLSNSSSKQVASSEESEDSDDVEMYEFPSQPLQRFTSPEDLEEEIMSVFEMLSLHVNTEINKTRTKSRILQIILSRRREFVGYSVRRALGQFSDVSQRIASELQSTLTEDEDLELIYQGPSRTNDQLACLIQECAQYSGYESYGELYRG